MASTIEQALPEGPQPVTFDLTDKDREHLAEYMLHDAQARELAGMNPCNKTGSEFIHNKVMTDIRTELQTIRAKAYLAGDKGGLTEAEELCLQQRIEEWRFADQPHPTYEQLYQSILDERES